MRLNLSKGRNPISGSLIGSGSGLVCPLDIWFSHVCQVLSFQFQHGAAGQHNTLDSSTSLSTASGRTSSHQNHEVQRLPSVGCAPARQRRGCAWRGESLSCSLKLLLYRVTKLSGTGRQRCSFSPPESKEPRLLWFESLNLSVKALTSVGVVHARFNLLKTQSVSRVNIQHCCVCVSCFSSHMCGPGSQLPARDTCALYSTLRVKYNSRILIWVRSSYLRD